MNPLVPAAARSARLIYYFRHLCAALVPTSMYRKRLAAELRRWTEHPSAALKERLEYYYRIRAPFPLPDAARPFRAGLASGPSAYVLDLLELVRYFDRSMRLAWQFGDNTRIPPCPTIVKSRPIAEDNQNAVLLNLNRVRHFVFVRDALSFEQKEDRLVWRGRAAQPQRKAFLSRFYANPRCDVGHYHKRHQDVPWRKPYLTRAEQLRYKFILAIEGNDVASSLKWILSSHSLCVMTRPRFETWFMEGRLVAGRHYVEVKDDYSDLEEKMDYYLRRPEEARAITQEANRWVDQFRRPEDERLLSLLVLWSYFRDSGQLPDARGFTL